MHYFYTLPPYLSIFLVGTRRFYLAVDKCQGLQGQR